MDLFLAISQAIGVSLAVGFRPFLAALLVGVLARANAGIDFSGSDFDFLESIPFLAAMLAGVALTTVYERPPRVVPFAAGAAVAVGLGALLFAGSLAAEDESALLGLPAGAVCSLIGFAAARSFFGGAIERLADRNERQSAVAVGLVGDVSVLLVVVLSVLLPPIAYLVLGFCLWILISGRRRASRKYEGLRVLR